MSEKEVWKPIQNFEGYYEVSSLGRVRSLDRRVKGKNNSKIFKKGKILKQKEDRAGYFSVGLKCRGIRKRFLTHRLVAQVFIPNPENKPQVNHRNGKKTDNRVENLEWCSRSENVKHAYAIGLQKSNENHGQSKLTNEQVKEIRKQYKYGDRELSCYGLAKKYGVTKPQIHNIVTHKQRKNIE